MKKNILKMALICPHLAVGGMLCFVWFSKQRRIVRFSFVKCGGLDFRYEGLYVST